MASNVVLVKLNNGEEVVADYSVKDKVVTLKNPARFMIAQDGIGMMPWVPLSNEKSFKIDASLVMFTAAVDVEIKNAYNERFGSGVVLATSMPPTLKLSE